MFRARAMLRCSRARAPRARCCGPVGERWCWWVRRCPVLSPSVRLIATPGHTAEDITTLAATADGVHACTHAWWASAGPAEDPFAPDPRVLAASRAAILGVAAVIIPGHGPAFVP